VAPGSSGEFTTTAPRRRPFSFLNPENLSGGKMNLVLNRLESTDTCTPGDLFLDGEVQCHTLEPPRYFEGQENVHEKCCILPGTYEVVLVHSQKFGRIMPLLVGVPGRSAIEIHQGNVPEDTQGCILVGAYRTTPCEITGSVVAFKALFQKLQLAVSSGNRIWLQVLNA
jgi:hypothetical protein